MKSPISTHVLDTSRGVPAKGIRVRLERKSKTGWSTVGTGVTDSDGRCTTLVRSRLSNGVYRLTFETGRYFRTLRVKAFFPYVTTTFHITSTTSHYHIPLLLSPYGYTTYRGS